MNSFGVYLTLLCASFMFVALISGQSVCSQESMCKCVTDAGTIDLSPLSNTVFTALDVKGTESIKYSPCSDNNTSPCMEAMLCKTSLSDHVTVGRSSGETFIKTGAKYGIQYPGDMNMTSVVYLRCDTNMEADGSLKILSDDDDLIVLELRSPYACVGGPPKTSPTTPKSTTPSGSKTTTPKGTKTTPKGTKTTTPKGTKTTTPKGTKTTTPKGTKTTPKGTKTTPKGTKTTPKGTKTTPKGTKTTPKGTKTTPKGTKTTPKGTPTTPKIHSTTHNAASSLSLVTVPILTLVYMVRRVLC